MRRSVSAIVFVALGAAPSGCAEVVVEDGPTGVADEPLTCDLREGSLVLAGNADNPGRPVRVTCDVWFGHGQHLTCPGFNAPPTPFAFECDIWDCLCSPEDQPEVVANFATGEVLDSRDGGTCRYTMLSQP